MSIQPSLISVQHVMFHFLYFSNSTLSIFVNFIPKNTTLASWYDSVTNPLL